MKYPKFLQPNGTIGFVAPSFGCVIEPYYSAFNNALKKFENMGYKTHLGPNCFQDCGIGISNTPYECGKELTNELLSENSDCIISCGGGELMCEILEYVDFNAIAHSTPKWFMGYSDNTNYTFLSATLCDIASIYGPCASSFGMEPWHESIDNTWKLFTGQKFTFNGYTKWESESLKSENNPLASINATSPSVIHTYPSGDIQMEGRLLGGCLDVLAGLVGTKYDKVTDFAEKYSSDGILWYLEACDLNVLSIRRAMWQLDNAGWFKNCSGFIIGRPMHFDEPIMGLTQYNAVVDIISKYDVPILMDADIGHINPMIPLICGSLGKVVTQGNSYSIEMILK